MSSSDRWTDKSKTSECISWKVSHSHSSLQFRWWTGYLGLTEKVILCLWHDQGRSDKNSWNKRYWWFVIYNHWLSIYFTKVFKTVKLQIKSNSGEIFISRYTNFFSWKCCVINGKSYCAYLICSLQVERRDILINFMFHQMGNILFFLVPMAT